MKRLGLVLASVLVSVCTALGVPVVAHADQAIPTQWTKVSAGFGSTCAIDVSAHLWCWGINYNHELGDGTTEDRHLPVPIGEQEWASVRVGVATTCGVQVDGSGWCWGENGFGQVGNGYGVAPYDQNESSGTTEPSPQPVMGPTRWKLIVPGAETTCGLSTGDGLYCWGSDNVGLLANGPDSGYPSATPVRINGSSTWQSVAVGPENVCAVRTTGQAFCWGDGSSGATGDGNTATHLVPRAIAGTWKRIEMTDRTACGVTTAGVTKCWGANLRGQTGTGGSNEYRAYPTSLAAYSRSLRTTKVGQTFGCGITASTDAALVCFGTNGEGEFGDDEGHRNGSSTPLLAADGKTGWTSVSVGDVYACGVRINHKLFCWGAGTWGELGVGSLDTYGVPVQVGLTPTVPPLQ